MKENPVFIKVYPSYKERLKLEAASKGISMIEFTKQVAAQSDKTIESDAKEWLDKWNGKWKRVRPEGYDFP